jgi:NADH dehydrogenase
MIVVVGGTGRLGRLVVERLLREGEPVRVVARHTDGDARRLPGLDVVSADVRDPRTLAAPLEDADVVVSAVQGLDPAGRQSPAAVDRDGNINLVRAAVAAGAAVVLVSVVGAGPDSPLEIARMKWAAEEQLRASGAPWTIVRATAFLELWTELLQMTARRSGVATVFGRGTNLVNVVPVQHVAVAVARAATDPSLRGQVIDVGGPENLTLTELATRVSDGRTPRHVPRPVLRAVSILAAPVKPGQARLARQALAMDSAPLAFDAGPSLTRYPWLPSTDAGTGG